jgi:perosamine synthetase
MIHARRQARLCDIDDTYTIDPEDARKKITEQDRGILPVHLYGRPANLDAIMKLASENGPVGDRRLRPEPRRQVARPARWLYTEHAAFSFYPSKNLTVFATAGRSRPAMHRRAARRHAPQPRAARTSTLHEKVGFNLRFNEIQAAVGREQLKVLDDLNSAGAAPRAGTGGELAA